METYQEFLRRIHSFEKPQFSIGQCQFTPSQSVLTKVKEDNTFAKFYGDTVVFDLMEKDKKTIATIIQVLYEEVPECFCEKLCTDTLHMTLHDLSNSSRFEEILSHMMHNCLQLLKAFHHTKSVSLTIQMRTNYIINMVNTSVVLALCPVNEEEYFKLMHLYEKVDEVKQLPYPFTPHITLAYYNRNGFHEQAAQKLMDTVNTLNQMPFEITLFTDHLVYQKFTSMNHYETISELLK